MTKENQASPVRATSNSAGITPKIALCSNPFKDGSEKEMISWLAQLIADRAIERMKKDERP